MLPAFRPNPDLLGMQLTSIQAQTRGDFRCLIGADGDQEEVRRMVEQAVPGDERFQVLGWQDNLGFYLNVERLLVAVPADAHWVALSDQDDRWYPTKLERLVPQLTDAALVCGQARVVTWPGGRVVLAGTTRRVVPVEDLLIQNQVTGSFAVLRAGLLQLALPFPRLPTSTQLHDHWLGLCAALDGGYAVLGEVLQDYLQHGGNAVGESAMRGPWTPARFIRRVRDLADRYEGKHSWAACARACQVQAFGWRRTMLEALAARTPLPGDLERVRVELSLDSSGWHLVRWLWRSTASPGSRAATGGFLPGLPYEWWERRRRAHHNKGLRQSR